MDSYLHPIEKAVIQGGITGLATCVYYGYNAQASVPYLGQTNLCYVAGGVGALTSVINDVIHKFVKEEVPIRKKAEDYTSIGLGVGVGAVMYNYALCLVNPNLCRDTGIITNSIIGGGSEFAGSFLYNLFVA